MAATGTGRTRAVRALDGVTPPLDPRRWLADASAAADRRRARLENFPVASRLLPGEVRADLFALYGAARLIDEVGDAYPGGPQDRLAVLATVDDDLDRLARGRVPEIPALRALMPAVARGLSPAPLHDLVEANRRDQLASRYATFAELRAYCRYSADPIGRLVLDVFGLATPERQERSDEVCTALQIAEHLQDVGEDFRNGRIYVPQDSLARFDVSERLLADLADRARAVRVPGRDRARVSALLAAEAGRARDLLRSGSGLLELVSGRPRLAIAGFVAGGFATLDAVTSAGADAIALTQRPRPIRTVRHAARLLLAGPGVFG